jgi:hypothetical protein
MTDRRLTILAPRLWDVGSRHQMMMAMSRPRQAIFYLHVCVVIGLRVIDK